MKTYEETLEILKNYAIGLNMLVRTSMINTGTFSIIGYFVGVIYGVSDEKIVEDFQIEKNGITYKLIEIKK